MLRTIDPSPGARPPDIVSDEGAVVVGDVMKDGGTLPPPTRIRDPG